MNACRNSPDGWHTPGPPSEKGNYFCIHCGTPLLGVRDDNTMVGVSIFVIVICFILAITVVALTW